jgi:protease IV
MANDAPQLTPVATPSTIVIQPPPTMFGRFGKLLLTVLGIAVLVIISLVARYNSYFTPADRPQEKYHSLARYATKKIAIINVDGVIMEGDGFVKHQIDSVKDDKDVVAVVLRIDSPGGTVTGSDYLYHHLRMLAEERKIPIVVSMGSICASGGYYLAMSVGDQAEAIYAEPTTWTGSIGVIIPHYDLSGLMGRWNVADDSVASGPLKQMGSPTKPMTPEERKILQTLVDDTFASFKQIVINGRPKFKDDPKALDAVATGQVFTAKQALDRGLVDKIGFIEDAINRAVALSGETADNVRCVKYEQPTTFASALLRGQSNRNASALDPSAWLALSSPRAYYLWTVLPALLSNSHQN